MKRLNKALINNDAQLPEFLEVKNYDHLPERIVQFGEGNFLRGFVDWMVHQLNKQGLFNGRIAAIQPTPHGKVVPKLTAQDGLYTFVLQGIEDGREVEKYEIISSISRGINPYSNWEDVLALAESPSIEFVFSNTTEAGLTYSKEAYNPTEAPLSFPGKLTAFLYHRYSVNNGDSHAGLTIIPCELVEENGMKLKEIVFKIAEDWNLSSSFIDWVKDSNQFCNTLVDRIVPGFPKDNIEQFEKLLGYEDLLIGVGEPYHLFAIDGDENVKAALPFHQAGLNVKWGDVTPYRNLKVSILNAPHTMMFSVGYLSGFQTVYEATENETLHRFVQRAIDEEILPTVSFDEKTKREFAESVIERFRNPFVKHYLVDLGLNAVSKFRARVLPLFLHWTEEKKQIPMMMSFSLAALITYYRSKELVGEEHMIGRCGGEEYKIRDSKEAIKRLHEAWKYYDQTRQGIEKVVWNVLEDEKLWGTNLVAVDKLHSVISDHVKNILEYGMKQSAAQLVENVQVH
ncbi:tagaturonate reductase [Bacillus taeanensis]|uniref:Tagaturonate reductase n=1 Tax=Bacillus taeanensis TaxID=273032 RepID=A0A366XY88_9BACI|nr:tagaturonate reductase [Bacillus taeanensis]RBW69729.1 tagaturonate reductase [Bacillus taeanensis]